MSDNIVYRRNRECKEMAQVARGYPRHQTSSIPPRSSTHARRSYGSIPTVLLYVHLSISHPCIGFEVEIPFFATCRPRVRVNRRQCDFPRGKTRSSQSVLDSHGNRWENSND